MTKITPAISRALEKLVKADRKLAAFPLKRCRDELDRTAQTVKVAALIDAKNAAVENVLKLVRPK